MTVSELVDIARQRGELTIVVATMEPLVASWSACCVVTSGSAVVVRDHELPVVLRVLGRLGNQEGHLGLWRSPDGESWELDRVLVVTGQ